MTDGILEGLKADIRNMQPQDYVAVKSFARSLLAELQSPPSHNYRPHAGGLYAAARRGE